MRHLHLFFFKWRHLLISLSASDFLVRKQIGSLFFEDQLSCKRPFEPPEAAKETWLGVQMMFSYAGPSTTWAFAPPSSWEAWFFKHGVASCSGSPVFFKRNLGTLCLPLGQADSRWISGEKRSSEVGLASWHLKTCKSLLSRWCRQGCSQNWWFRLKLHNAHNARSNI